MTKYCRRCGEEIFLGDKPSPEHYQYVAIQPTYCGARGKRGMAMTGEILYFHNSCFNASILAGNPRYMTPGCLPS